ncbi:hypothetical protein F4778DRAFT_789372 [Xylariomycetidae sp. FL2044]|nr:hypothetical protein F4778DRAFT_789372 [Xylariomycetidae sp. FL2044]
MADLGWLRLGQRSRTPTTTATSDDHNKRSGPARVSSYLSLNSLTSTSSSEPVVGPLQFGGGDGSSNSSHLVVRSQDNIWYNPSLVQMCEALQSAMMTRGVLEPLPVEYNAYVLHIVEAYVRARDRVAAAESSHAEAQESLQRRDEQLRTLADDWLARETRYKAEIKRLEVLLARTSSDGLEAVTLARTASVVERSGPEVKEFLDKLRGLGTQPQREEGEIRGKPSGLPQTNSRRGSRSVNIDEQGNQAERRGSFTGENLARRNVLTPKILDEHNDALVSQKIISLEAAARATGGSRDTYGRRRRVREPVDKSPDIIIADGSYTELQTTHAKNANPLTAGVAVAVSRADEHNSRPQLFSNDMTTTRPCPSDHIAVMGEERALAKTDSRRRSLLEDLLGSSESGDGATHRQTTTHGGGGGTGEAQTASDMGRYMREPPRRDGDIAGFSFVPGDDRFPIGQGSQRIVGVGGSTRTSNWCSGGGNLMLSATHGSEEDGEPKDACEEQSSSPLGVSSEATGERGGDGGLAEQNSGARAGRSQREAGASLAGLIPSADVDNNLSQAGDGHSTHRGDSTVRTRKVVAAVTASDGEGEEEAAAEMFIITTDLPNEALVVLLLHPHLEEE